MSDIQVLNEDFFGCTIKILNKDGSPKIYQTKHNKSRAELHTLNAAEAFKAAKLLDLDYRVCSWFSEVH